MSPRILRPRWYHLALLAAAFAVLLVQHMARSGDTDGYENVGYWIGQGQGIVTTKVNIPFQDSCPQVAPGRYVFVYQPFGLPLFYALVGYERTLAAHRVLHVLLFALLSLLVFRIAGRIVGSERRSALSVLLVLACPFVAAMAGTALADLTFLVAFLAALYLLVLARERRAEGRGRVLVLAAALCAALGVAFRAAGIVLLVSFGWFACGDLLARRYRKALLDALAYLPFVAFCAFFLYRNYHYSGSVSGLSPASDVSLCASGFGRGAWFGCKELIHAFVPDTWFNSPVSVARRILSSPLAWQPWANALCYVLLGIALYKARGAIRGLRAAAASPREAVLTPASLLIVTSLFYLVLLVIVLSHIGEQGFEFRYYIPLVGMGWPLLIAAGREVRGRILLLALLGFVTYGYLAEDAAFIAERSQRAALSGRQPAWASWIDGNTPAEATFLTDRDAVASRRPRRHVYWITTWHCGYALPERLRSAAGVAQYAREKSVDYVVLGTVRSEGRRDAARANYGEFILALMERREWPDKVLYADDEVTVYDMSSVR